MKRAKRFFAVTLVLIVSSVQCALAGNLNSFLNSNKNDVLGTTCITVYSVEGVEATQKSVHFYERLLENFCRTYFRDCFSVKYETNSISSVNITKTVGSTVYVTGKHSFTGSMTHNDKTFYAQITYKGGNRYEVWFKKPVVWLVGSDTWEYATRNLYYSD